MDFWEGVRQVQRELERHGNVLEALRRQLQVLNKRPIDCIFVDKAPIREDKLIKDQ